MRSARHFLVFALVALSFGLAAQERDAREANDGPEREDLRENLIERELYWAHRVAYPTGAFDARWLLRAYEQDQRVASAVPNGRVTYERTSASALALDASQFTSLGPKPLLSGSAHVSGRANVIVVDPIVSSVAYFGSDGGGVWKTTNCCSAATTWTAVTDDPLLSTIAIDDLTIDPGNHDVVLAGTGDLNFGSFSAGAAGVLKSTDQGATWALKGASVFTAFYPPSAGGFPQYQAVGKVRVDPRNSNIVLAGTKTGLFFSYDGGDTWSGPCLTNTFGAQRQDVTGLLLSDNGTSTDIYAAIGARGFATTVQPNLNQNGANGLYKSSVPASGCPASWTALTNGWPAGTTGGTPFPANVLGRIDLAMAPSNHSVIYAQVQSITAGGVPATQLGGQLGVWRTTDAGATWTQRSTVSALATGCGMDYNQNWYDQGLAVDPNNPDVLFMDTFDIWKSTDGGATFSDYTCGYNGGPPGGGDFVHVDQHALAFVPGSSSTLLTGSDGGVYVTLNATAASPQSIQLNDSVSTIEFYSGDITADFANSAAPGIAAGAQDNGCENFVWSGTPGPALWTLRNGGDGMYSHIEPKLGLRWYYESQNGVIRVSTTGPTGGTAAAAPTGAWGGDRLSFVFPYEIDKFNCPGATCDHMIAGTFRVWETLSGAIPRTSWRAASPDLTRNTLADRSFINQLAFAPTDTTVAAAGTNDGFVQYGTNLGQTVPAAVWTNITNGNVVLPNRPILDVAISPASTTVVYAAAGGFDENSPGAPGHVFMASCASACTTPASWTWTDKTGNLPNIPADSIIANPRFPQQIFVGTDWGLYFTNDINVATPVWFKFTAGLPRVMIWDMAVDRGAGADPLASSTTLALFTRSRGAYAWPLPSGPITPLELQGFTID